MTYKTVVIWWSTGERTDFRGADKPDEIDIDGSFLRFYYLEQKKVVAYSAATIDRIETARSDD